MKEEFYQIKEKKVVEQTIVYQVELNKEHSVYQGHFPDIAVSPGVMLTDMVRTLCQEHLGIKLQLKEGKNIKFLQPVLPQKETRFEVALSLSEGDPLQVKATAMNENGTYFKVSSVYESIGA